MVVESVKQNEGNLDDSLLTTLGLEPGEQPDFDKLLPEFQDSDFLVFIKAFINLLNIDFSIEYNPDIKYNKKYFAKYYGIDEKTFNKWVDTYCPLKFKNRYEKKRQLNKYDWNMIMAKFGQCDNITRKPYTRGEIDKLVYGDSNISCREDLDKFLNKKRKKHNVFPPEVVYAFLKHMDAPEIQHHRISREKEIPPKQKLRIIVCELLKAKNMTEQDRYKFKKEVRKFLGWK